VLKKQIRVNKSKNEEGHNAFDSLIDPIF
jgi:hypothetical protein